MCLDVKRLDTCISIANPLALLDQQISIPRAAAFIKRFSTSALNMPDNVIQHYLTFVKKLLNVSHNIFLASLHQLISHWQWYWCASLQREPRLDALIQSEDKAGNGVYLPTLDDPELCNPFATSLYELFLYQVGYNSGRCFSLHSGSN